MTRENRVADSHTSLKGVINFDPNFHIRYNR
jgi:hypothetical protein